MSFDEIARGTAGIFPENELKDKLASRHQLQVKLGIDPTAPDIHLGHSIILRKLRQFQDLGHRAVLIIGEFTALVGDPTGRNATRPVLTKQQIQVNAQTFFEQASIILDADPKKLKLVSNSEWFNEDFSIFDFMELAGEFTAQQLWRRDSFKQRAKAGVDINLQEFLYPLFQAYDSVCVLADVELGGTDQTFNLQRARELQVKSGYAPQVVITMPLLRGTDGQHKMSKSYGNHIGLADDPNNMFGKIMSIPDALMPEWFDMLTSLDQNVLITLHPKKAKEHLAWEIVKSFHGFDKANAAQKEFNNVFSKRQLPNNIKTKHIGLGPHSLVDIIINVEFAPSKTQARKLISAGAVKLNDRKETNIDFKFMCDAPQILKVGKRRICKLEK